MDSTHHTLIRALHRGQLIRTTGDPPVGCLTPSCPGALAALPHHPHHAPPDRYVWGCGSCRIVVVGVTPPRNPVKSST